VFIKFSALVFNPTNSELFLFFIILSAIKDKLAFEYNFGEDFFVILFLGSTLATTLTQELLFCQFKQISQLSLVEKILFQI
jgi:hypothetical protein